MFFRALFSVPILIFFLVSPAFAQGAIETVNITAKIRTYILDAPRPEGVFIQRFEQGATKTAYGRDDSGEWLRVMDGWAVAAVMETDGDLTQLADMSRSVNFSISDGAWIYAGPSTKWFERVTELQKGSRGFAIGRNDSGSWLRVPGGWLEMEQIAKAGDTRALPVVQFDLIIVAATTRTFILAAPDIGAEFVDVFDAGAEALATEQSADGMWVKIDRGWVSRDAVSMSGSFATATPVPSATPTVTPTRDPTATPTATPVRGLRVVATIDRTVWSRPTIQSQRRGRMVSGESAVAVERNRTGNWLQIDQGWIYVGSSRTSRYVKVYGDIWNLPVTS